MEEREMKIKKLTKKQLKRKEKREINRQFKEWSLKVKERDGFKCCLCSKTENLNAHHILPREIKEFRFDIDNGITLCPSHHKYSLEISSHRNPFVFYTWFLYNRTKQYFELIKKIKMKGGQIWI
jgi:hypothetical protein